MRIQELAQGIHTLTSESRLPDLMYSAFDVLPTLVLTPHDAFQEEVRGNIESCPLQQMIGRVSANMILPYPPGVPLIMPGEMITEASKPVLDFLQLLCDIGAHYPGFETDIHGVQCNGKGEYEVVVLKNHGAQG
ncbi:hypothetical protein N4G58_15430 [Edwardsiella piscicida]|nr:hypothetical protein N4G58_15430 [Edwardsiella piscicida]